MALPSKNKTPYDVLIEETIKLHLADLPEKDIKHAVELCREHIQSNRVISYIKDIHGLISILEARNALNPQNVDTLLQISKAVNRPAATRRVDHYRNCFCVIPADKPQKLIPLFDIKQESYCKGAETNSINCRICSTILLKKDLTDKELNSRMCKRCFSKEELTNKVCSEVARSLGKDVRSFARALGSFSEGEIMGITNNQECEEATLKVLAELKKKKPNVDIIPIIVQALQYIRRLDICRKIKSMTDLSDFHN